MFERFNDFLFNTLQVDKNQKFLLAVSGGIDSMAMLQLFQNSNFYFRVAHCNFHLRGSESTRDMEFITNYCSSYNIPLSVIEFDTFLYAENHKLSIQLAARELRYNWFEKIRKEYNLNFIATAHHLDDQAETIFINLLRGTGLGGLHGIPQKTKTLIRPMLFTNRKMITEYCVSNKIPFVEDSSNVSDKYLRNNIRHNILPIFVNQNPKFVFNLSQTANYISKIETFIKNQINQTLQPMLKMDGDKMIMEISALQQLKDYDIYLSEFLFDYGFNKTTIDNLISQLNSPKSGIRFFSERFRLLKDRNELILSPLSDSKQIDDQEFWLVSASFSSNSPVHLDFLIIDYPENLKTPDTIAYFDYDKLIFPLIIRRWQQGDSFYPFGMKGKKLLSDYFIDNKFSEDQKKNIYLLCSGDSIIWIIGYRTDDRYKITNKTRIVLKVEYNNGINKKG